MPTRRISLRWLLVAVTILASLAFAASGVAVGRLLRLSSEQRRERGREQVERELAEIVAEPDPDPAAGPGRPRVLGLRAGFVEHTQAGPTTVRSGVSPEADRALATFAAVAPDDRAEVGSVDSESGTIFLGARRRPDGRVVWAAFTVTKSKSLVWWRITIASLTALTVLLSGIALAAVVAASRGARALTRSLVALERDLSTPVPRPAIAELAQVADGIAALSRGLADAQVERERMALELRRQERLAALGRVVAGVAHEVRNPLASMKLRVDLARGASPSGEVAGELDALGDEIERLDRLVTDFLVVSGRRVGRRVPSELGELARDRVARLGPWAAERGVGVRVEGDASARGDRDSCARALDNLVRNAVEASSVGAEVRVRIERRGLLVAVCVEDQGPGVPEEHLHALFEPFFTTKPDGTGLGLAVSHAIALASGGELSYRRDRGVTCFEFALAGEGGAV